MANGNGQIKPDKGVRQPRQGRKNPKSFTKSVVGVASMLFNPLLYMGKYKKKGK